jgi:hypothetical protein
VSDRRLHIAIDVSLAEDQIRGEVGDGVRQPRPFSGWLGLIGELDGLLGSITEPTAAPPAPVADRPREGGSR